MVGDIQSDGGCCPSYVSVDILCCYWCWLQSDPALLPPDSQTAKLLPPLVPTLTLTHTFFYLFQLPSRLNLFLLTRVHFYPVPEVASVKNDHEIGPSGSSGVTARMFEKWGDGQKANSRGPFQHSCKLCYLDRELCRRTGARRRIGQEKAINTLWNWCGRRKFRKRCKGKQHCIMYLLTFPCTACQGW